MSNLTRRPGVAVKPLVSKVAMHIALDYDLTYTADREGWDAFITLMRARFHVVSIVSYRDAAIDWNADLTRLRDELKIPVHCTGGVAKKWWCQTNGVRVDVWIDDSPKSIFENSSMSPEDLAQWRADDKTARAA